MTPILILAAGQSSRMRGRDKLLETIDGVPLIRRQVLRAIATGEPVFVAVPSRDHPRTVHLDGLGATLVPVINAAEGLSASLRQGLSALPHADAVLISLADLVDIETQDLERVIAAKHAVPDMLAWRGATAGGKPGHPILVSSALTPAFMTLTGDQGGGHILRERRAQTHLVPLAGDRALLDLDTPEDWAAWRAKRQI